MIPLVTKLTTTVALATFGVAVAYVIRPTERRLILMRPASLAVIFATVSGLLGGWIEILAGVAATPDGALPVAALYRGMAASLRVGFVCFGLLACAWLLVGAGMLRRASVDAG